MASNETEIPTVSWTSDTIEFIELATTLLKWGELTDADGLMDIGCGNGSSTIEILNAFPAVKTLLAVDKSFERIEEAKALNARSNIEYFVGNVQVRFTLKRWLEEMTRIFSFYCLNYVSDQRRALWNIYNLLKPGGGAAILFMYNFPIFSCIKQLYNEEELQKYQFMYDFLTVYPHETNILKFSDYEPVLNEIGFEIVLCEKVDREYVYASKEEFIYFLTCIYEKHIMPLVPEVLREDFKKRYFEKYEKENGQTSDGRQLTKCSFIRLVLRKPNYMPEPL